MNIGWFQKEENGFSGSIETLAIQLKPVRFVRRDKGADYVLQGPNCEVGAAWRKAGEWGDYLSVKLDCPSLAAPINATMKLTADTDGYYRLNWQRRRESNGRDE